MDERLLDVNEHGVLRVPGVMWVSLALLARHWFWTLFIFMGGGSSMVLLSQGIPWWPILSQLPAILLLVVGAYRLPGAGGLVRGIWRRAHWLATGVVVFNLCWTSWSLANSNHWQPRPELVLVCFSTLDLVIAWSLWSSKYLRQVIAEFPLEPSALKP